MLWMFVKTVPPDIQGHIGFALDERWIHSATPQAVHDPEARKKIWEEHRLPGLGLLRAFRAFFCLACLTRCESFREIELPNFVQKLPRRS